MPGFPKRVRLLKAGEFDRVFATRNSVADSKLVLHGAPNQLGFARLGLTVSRRVGGAVVRNRWKRLLREAFRLTQKELPPFDFVCVARGGEPPTLDQLMTAIPALARRIEIRSKRDATRTQDRLHE